MQIICAKHVYLMCRYILYIVLHWTRMNSEHMNNSLRACFYSVFFFCVFGTTHNYDRSWCWFLDIAYALELFLIIYFFLQISNGIGKKQPTKVWNRNPQKGMKLYFFLFINFFEALIVPYAFNIHDYDWCNGVCVDWFFLLFFFFRPKRNSPGKRVNCEFFKLHFNCSRSTYIYVVQI